MEPMKPPLHPPLLKEASRNCEAKTCPECKNNFSLRKDRPAAVVIYQDTMGSIPGTHYHHYCSNRRCSYTRHYGYHTLAKADGSHESLLCVNTRNSF